MASACAVANGGTADECSVCTLDSLGRGQKGRVCAVAGPNRCRLMELGFTSGTEVEVSRRAAFGGPLEVRLRSYRLSLRRDEALSISLEVEAGS
jgi:ferrous iron transport protein A